MMKSNYSRAWGSKLNKLSKISKLCVNIQVKKNIHKQSDADIGRYLCNELQNMGPSFVKIGQFMSSRSDIFGKEFTNQLKTLQDQVKPFDTKIAQDIIASHNLPLKTFNADPIASASIGQVHYAELDTGEQVVVKIKRPYIRETVEEDFQLLRAITSTMKRFSNHRRVMELDILFKEYYELLLEEIDYNAETNNMKIFKKAFRSDRWLKVPKVYDELCSQDIIVMEYVPAIKINNIKELDGANFDTSVIADKLAECYFKQIIYHGYVHIDPHPGNLGMTQNGKIVFYDYGMVVKIDDKLKQRFNDILLLIYERDIEEICKVLQESNIIYVEEDKVPYLKRFVASFLTYIDNLDVTKFKLSYIDKIDQSEMQFVISSKFILILRGLSILEGLCKKLNKDFNYTNVIGQYTADMMSFVDINYIEKKGNRDLASFQDTPKKVLDNEISLGMIEKDVDKLKKQVTTMNLGRSINFVVINSIIVMDPNIDIYVKIGIVSLSFIAINKE
jgi:predicted unusual protein kinase regulating ubiquinone biosynthesis (AarF/ABC1/UbiB family)